MTARSGGRRWRWSRRLLPLVLVVLTVASRAANASEESKRLYARGLVEFNAGRFQEALQQYERAVAADPNDPYALYYRGITRARLDDLPGAISDLRQVVSMPNAPREAALELGVALVQNEQYAEAVRWLERAQRVASLDARASLFLGIAQLRLGRSETARENFDRAAEGDPALHVPARYYQGVVAYEQGRFREAEAHFGYVATYSSGSAMGREAAAFLAKIRRGEGPLAEVYGTLGLEYDSNVVLAPSEGFNPGELGISGQSDGRGTITAGGLYAPWQTAHTQFTVGYEFYQSLHFDLTEFNLQDHRPNAQFVVNVDRFQLGLAGHYDYYFLDTDSFLQEGAGLPWFAVKEGDLGRTEIFYRVRRRDFKKQEFELRNAFNHAAGIRQTFNVGSIDRYVSVGYRYDHESPIDGAGNVFAYDGHEVGGGVGWDFPAAFTAGAAYTYRHEDYDAGASMGRKDNEHQVIVSLAKQLTDRFTLTAAYFGTFNNSNQAPFQYERHIGSLALEVRLY